MTEWLIFAACFLLAIIIGRKRNGKRKDERRHPPSFPSLPIVGSLPFIKDSVNIAEFFMKKGSELGPVFTVKVGGKVVVVLNNLEAIEDAFVRHASSFSGRSGSYPEKYIMNRSLKGIGFKNYSPEFARYRRLTMSIFKEYGFGSKSRLEGLILTQVSQLIQYITKKNGKAFDPDALITLSATNVPHNMILGKGRKLEEGPNELLIQMKRYANSMDPALDIFPILRFFPPHNHKLANIIDSNEKFFKLREKEIHDIIRDKTTDCFIRRYIDREGPNYDHEQLMYTIRDFYGASLDTTSSALLSCIIYLTNHPHVAKRMQKEIDSVVPRDRLPSGSDQPMLPYTEATILEILRLRPSVPLGLPRLTLHDTEVLGYFVPSDTMVIPNIKSAHMNSTDWPDAEIFKPERFLNDDGKLINKNRIIAFSLGRRSCPGEPLARAQLFLFISGLLQKFSFLPPVGMDRISDKMRRGVVDYPFPFEVRMIARER